MYYQVVLSCADISFFISGSVAIDQRLNAASKKENNTEGVLIRCFLKTILYPLAHNPDEKNQALKLLFVTAAVNLVVQLDL